MSLQLVAADLARKGRGPDTVLVHMTPHEVAGLEALARRHYGKGLTYNPETGLPEAGILSSLLPAIAGIGLSAIGVSPLMAAGIVGGGTALATGSLSKGLMAGLGAYGGAGIGDGLASMGTTAAASTAAAGQAAPSIAGQAASGFVPAQQTSGLFGDVLGGMETVSPGFGGITQPLINNPSAFVAGDTASGFGGGAMQATPQAAAAAAHPGAVDPTYFARNGMDMASDLAAAKAAAAQNMSGFDKLMAGGKDAFSPGGFDRFTSAMGGGKKAMMSGLMALSPAMMAGGTKQPGNTAPLADDNSMIRPYTYDPRAQGFTAGTPYKAKEANEKFGRGYAPGGHVGDPLGQNIQSTYDAVNAALAGAGRQSFPTEVPNMTVAAHSYGALATPDLSARPGVPPPSGPLHATNGPIPSAPASGAGRPADDPYWYTPEAHAAIPGGSYNNTQLPAWIFPGFQNGDGYAGGGIARLVKGAGDGVSDSIPAVVDGRAPARIASGEYVVPARVVSELGNGSTDAGAARLDQMVRRVQQMRSKTAGTKKNVAVNSRAYRALPA